MIDFISRIFTNTRTAATTSIASAAVSVETSNMPIFQLAAMPLIQQIAIIIAILSGLVAIINGCDTFYQKHKSSFKSRVFRHWETSLLGVFLLVVWATALLTGSATFGEIWPGIPIILWLLYKKTPFKKPTNEDPDS